MAKAQPLRLLIVGISWPPETFLARLIRGLADSGIHVTLACSRKPDQEWLSEPNLDWLFVPTWKGSLVGRLLRLSRMIARSVIHSPSDIRLFASHVRNENEKAFNQRLRSWNHFLPFVGRRWDVIYFPWNATAITYLALFELGCPVVISCRGAQVNVAPHNPKRKAIREGLRLSFQKASAIHCVSEAIKSEAMQYGLPSQKAWVIRPAVDPDFFRPAEEPKPKRDILRVMTTGSLIWRKGYEYALLAIRQLVDQGVPVHFDIIGDGSERQRLLYTIHDLDLENHVRLHGSLSPEGVREQLQQAHVFLLASLSEGISNAVLEAMACGLPVVTTDCGGMREAVTDGVEGFVVPVRDPELMAKQLLCLASNSTLRQRMGKAARQRILQQFTLVQQIEKFIALYKSVL